MPSLAAPSVSYTTVTYDDCPSMSMETMITVTNGITVTYCPECDMHTTKPYTGPGYTTTYTTTYMSLCPTGMVPETYTVTESCTEPEPTWTPGPSHIPQGFTVTTKECHVCDKTPTTVTMTEPCGCEAHEGTPGPAKPAPAKPTPTGPLVSQIPDGQPQAPGSSGSEPSCDGDDCGGSGSGSSPPSGGSGGSPPACDGDDCGGSGSSSPPSGGSGGSPPSGGSGSSPPSGGSGDSPPACDGDDCGSYGSGSTPPAPGSPPAGGNEPMPTPCAGPACRAVATGGGMPGGNSTMPSSGGMPPVPTEVMIPPNNGASMAVISTSIMAVVVAALAFAL